MPNLFGRNDHAPALVMHTTVEQPIARGQTGRITCRPLGQEPITFVWTPRPNRLDESESDAVDVPPGRYRVVATDATGARAETVVDVQPTLACAVVVAEYRVTPATAARARDGVVEALGAGMDEGVRFLWTHGVVTDGPVLRDVPCGTYAAVAVPNTRGTPTTIHKCAPARVGVAPLG